MAKQSKKDSTTDLAVTHNQAALAEASAFDEFSGDGDKMTKDDLVIARYRIVQGMTRAKQTNRDLRDGDIYNTITKEGSEKVVVLNVLERRQIVERVDDSTGQFIRTMPIDDKRVTAALKANAGEYRGLKSVDMDPPTKFIDTYDVHVVFLSDDGEKAIGFGVLQFDSTQLFPRKQWKSDRVNAAVQLERPSLPSYAFRSVVTTQVRNNAANGTTSYIYKVEPFADRWTTSVLNPSVPEHLAILRNCKSHKQLLESGLFQVDYSSEDVEAGQDDGGYVNPDDDGRDPVSTPAVNEAPGF